MATKDEEICSKSERITVAWWSKKLCWQNNIKLQNKTMLISLDLENPSQYVRVCVSVYVSFPHITGPINWQASYQYNIIIYYANYYFLASKHFNDFIHNAWVDSNYAPKNTKKEKKKKVAPVSTGPHYNRKHNLTINDNHIW